MESALVTRTAFGARSIALWLVVSTIQRGREMIPGLPPQQAEALSWALVCLAAIGQAFILRPSLGSWLPWLVASIAGGLLSGLALFGLSYLGEQGLLPKSGPSGIAWVALGAVAGSLVQWRVLARVTGRVAYGWLLASALAAVAWALLLEHSRLAAAVVGGLVEVVYLTRLLQPDDTEEAGT